MAIRWELRIPPVLPTHKSTSAIITYEDHGYADGVSITAVTVQNLKIQLKKLSLLSKYTGPQLETSKFEATGALWAQVNPLTFRIQNILQEKINTIFFLDGIHITYLPLNKSYKMLGVHINPVLDFREHRTHITTDVRKLSKALTSRKLSPPYKILVVEQLLK
jgi:hypothetical protein